MCIFFFSSTFSPSHSFPSCSSPTLPPSCSSPTLPPSCSFPTLLPSCYFSVPLSIFLQCSSSPPSHCQRQSQSLPQVLQVGLPVERADIGPHHDGGAGRGWGADSFLGLCGSHSLHVSHTTVLATAHAKTHIHTIWPLCVTLNEHMVHWNGDC